jgi:hypothetical protein
MEPLYKDWSKPYISMIGSQLVILQKLMGVNAWQVIEKNIILRI